MKQNEIPFVTMADTARKNYEQALRTSLKFQEEALQWWCSSFNQSAAAQDWQKRYLQFSELANKAVPMAQKNLEEVMGFMQKSSRTSAELLKKAVQAAETPAISASQSKWLEFWSSSLGAMRSNAEALNQMNAQVMTAWIELVRQSAAAAVPKAAGA